MARLLAVYLEQAKRRTFAGALDWPGWTRSGRNPDEALRSLVAYQPRYAQVASRAGLDFDAAADLDIDIDVVERLAGDADTDRGSPSRAPAVDSRPVTDRDLQWFKDLLRACWQTFDAAAESAKKVPLSKTARGGGRDLSAVVAHVLDGDGGYLWRLATRKRGDQSHLDSTQQLELTRQALLDALDAAVHGQVPAVGPRGGARWSPRYFVRRVAWHVLDHAWEIEDRSTFRGGELVQTP